MKLIQKIIDEEVAKAEAKTCTYDDCKL